MEDKQKVFIRGVEGRGEEVLKTLEERGGKHLYDGGDQPARIYFIGYDGMVYSTPIESVTGKIIMDNYTELHLPEKWKDGDVLVSDEGLFFVLKGDFQAGDKDATIGAYCCVSEHQVCLSGHIGQIDYPHLASPSEVEHFHELLHNLNRDWDSEKKQLVDWKWKPKDGEDYYYILSNGIVHLSTWFDYKVDNSRFSIGNCFKTKEEAEAMAEKVKNLLKGE